MIKVTDEMVRAALVAYFPDGTYGIHQRMPDDVQSVVFDHMRAAIRAAMKADTNHSAARIQTLEQALEKIACRHVTEQPLWWQIDARSALAKAEGRP